MSVSANTGTPTQTSRLGKGDATTPRQFEIASGPQCAIAARPWRTAVRQIIRRTTGRREGLRLGTHFCDSRRLRPATRACPLVTQLAGGVGRSAARLYCPSSEPSGAYIDHMHTNRNTGPAVWFGLLAVNGIGIGIASAFSAQGLAKPNFAEPEQISTPLTRFWSASSAVRTWSLAVPMLMGLARQRPVTGLLVTAGLVQLGDSALGIWRRNPQMAIAPAIMGTIHLASARLLNR